MIASDTCALTTQLPPSQTTQTATMERQVKPQAPCSVTEILELLKGKQTGPKDVGKASLFKQAGPKDVAKLQVASAAKEPNTPKCTPSLAR